MALKTITFNYTGAVQTFVVPQSGLYKLECWGASGGRNESFSNNYGGKGGYSVGSTILNKGDILYIYVGGAGGTNSSTGGWNGGGTGTYSSGGGGASDIRKNSTTLVDRIIVAGGGGAGSHTGSGGDGGGLIGNNSSNNYETGGTQTAGGTGYASNGSFGLGGNSSSHGGPGGGGWYGGGAGHSCAYAGGGGSSYLGTLTDATTTAGTNTGNGIVTLTYNQDPTIYYLIKDGKIYLPCDKYYDVILNKFVQLDIATIRTELESGYSDAISIFKPFTKDGKTYNPFDIIDISKCKIGAMSLNTLSKLKLNYTPSDVALAKTNIKIKDKYLMTPEAISFGMYLDITATDKSKIDFFIDYGQAKSYKSSSILNKEMISDSFYANFKLNKPDGLLSSVTLYSNYYYKKLQESQMDVYDNFKDSAFVVFHDDYDLMLVNRIAKKELINYIETIDKF